MAQTFEELEVWKEAKEVSILIYKISRNGGFSKDFGLAGQIQRASVSVMSNIAEGFARGSNKDFVRFLFMARGSLAEVHSQLFLAKDLKYVDETEFVDLDGRIKRLSKRLTTFITRIDPNRKFGEK